MVHPLPSSAYNFVSIRLRKSGGVELPATLGDTGPLALEKWAVVSDSALPHLVRLTAMNADVSNL